MPEEQIAPATTRALAVTLRRLLDATTPTGLRDGRDRAGELRAGVETVTAQLEAGLVPSFEHGDIAAALRKEGLTPNTADYVVRVLTKLGVL